jgi:hypothetical protein
MLFVHTIERAFFFVDDDPDNTVSIMLDGIESRLHVINIDIDLVRDQYRTQFFD